MELDLDTLALAATSAVSDELRESIADLLFSVNSRGRTVLIHVLVEHKSAPERFTILHLLESCSRIWADFRRRQPKARHVPRILPVLVHHGRRGWTAPSSLAERFDGNQKSKAALARFDPTLPIVLLDLARCDDSRFDAVATTNALAGAALWLLKWSRARDFAARLLRHAHRLDRVAAAPGGREAFELLLVYVFSAGRGRLDPETFMDEFRKRAARETRKVMHTIGDSFIEFGIKKGRGLGELEGRRRAIQRVLRTRFGPLPAEIEDGLARIEDRERLERLVDAAVTATSHDHFVRILAE